jgi:hypothetical protein
VKERKTGKEGASFFFFFFAFFFFVVVFFSSLRRREKGLLSPPLSSIHCNFIMSLLRSKRSLVENQAKRERERKEGEGEGEEEKIKRKRKKKKRAADPKSTSFFFQPFLHINLTLSFHPFSPLDRSRSRPHRLSLSPSLA